MSFRNEFYRESKQKFATVTPNAEPSPWRRTVMLNLIQHMYNPSIYRPQIPDQAWNDVYLQKPVIAVSQAHSHVKRKVSNIRIPVTE